MAVQPPVGVEVSDEIWNFFRSSEWVHHVNQRWTRYVTDQNRLRPHHAQPAWGFPQMTWPQYLAGFNAAQYSRRFNPNVQQAPSLPDEMPPKKGGNAKVESGRAKKAENKARKKEEAAAAAERKEAAAWQDGAKQKKQRDLDRDAKKAADAARRAEAARQLAEEEAALSGLKPKGTGQKGAAAKQKGKAKDVIPAGPEAIAEDADVPDVDNPKEESQKVEEYAATGLDDALEMMRLVNTKMDKASVGQAAASIESHPERRFKAAFEAYKERTLPELKDEKPGLRLRQYNDIMYKQFQKHPDNPFNRLTVVYNATQEERVGVLQRQRERTEDMYRQQY